MTEKIPAHPIPARPLNADNVRVGENLRELFRRANLRRKPDQQITWRALAGAVPMNPVTLSRAVAGQYGLSEEKILGLARALGVHPGRIVARTSRDRFPNIPSATNRNKRDRATKGLTAASVETLLNTPRILSSFFGGIAPVDLPLFRRLLLDLHDLAAQKRTAAIHDGHYDPTTGKFRE